MGTLAAAINATVYRGGGDNPSLNLDLLNNIGVPSARLSAAATGFHTVTDHEGNLRRLSSQGQARFVGARREENLYPRSHWGQHWQALGTNPPTVDDNQDFGSDRVGVTITFPPGAGGYAGSRASGEYAGFSVPYSHWSRYWIRYSVRLSRALTGTEVITFYVTGSLGMFSANISVATGLAAGVWHEIAYCTNETSGPYPSSEFSIFTGQFPVVFSQNISGSSVTVDFANLSISQGRTDSNTPPEFIPTSLPMGANLANPNATNDTGIWGTYGGAIALDDGGVKITAVADGSFGYLYFDGVFNGAAADRMLSSNAPQPYWGIGRLVLIKFKARVSAGHARVAFFSSGSSYPYNIASTTWKQCAVVAILTIEHMTAAQGYLRLDLASAGLGTNIWIKDIEVYCIDHGAYNGLAKYYTTTSGVSLSDSLTMSGASVAGHVVDGAGSPISASTLKGLLIEPAVTNYAYWSHLMGVKGGTNIGWEADGAAVTRTDYADVAPEGAYDACRVVTAASGNTSVFQMRNLGAALPTFGPITVSVWLRRTAGAGAIALFFGSDTEDEISAFSVTPTSSWVRYTKTYTFTTTARPVFKFGLANNGANWNQTLLFGNWQVELSRYPHSDIITQGANRVKPSEYVSFPASIFDDTKGAYDVTLRIEYGGTAGEGSQALLGPEGGGTTLLYDHDSANAVAMYDATNLEAQDVSSLGHTFAAGFTARFKGAWGGSYKDFALTNSSGVLTAANVGTNTFDGTMGGAGSRVQIAPHIGSTYFQKVKLYKESKPSAWITSP